MIRKARGFLQWFLGGTFTLIIAACYGAPMARAVPGAVGAISQTGSVRITGPGDSPIGGLQVDVIVPSYRDSGGRDVSASTNSAPNLTGASGRASYDYPAGADGIELRIRDIDGTNGGAVSTTNVRLYDAGQEASVIVKTN